MKKPAEKIIAHVDPDLRDLIPGYLENRQKDITTIKKALSASDFDKIRVLGHSMRGSGGGYGFMPISKIGEAFEKAAKKNDPDQVKNNLAKLSDFLQRVTLVYD
ncbi:MAG: Hpt domain-containing protein [Nitrospina sp.]|jgi:HPt (histidine-containing phosphotransfer) domain-containing protein|nr:Hpt domain-containing protein [Nitrospina sp.]MBT3508004.1 Hpt domain-containing protein [Nitrospina sp.]MBT3876531.1 Hpt domain-containing protein [Nitrospina sp.]MBT4049550.1 Hpt domain-containing protein [Nitrospina sp.]MBT4558262.1 Hpt domain-containing protein [Nitrospina sp.]